MSRSLQTAKTTSVVAIETQSLFGRLLHEWRVSHGLRQKEAAAILKVNLRTFQGYERGDHLPPNEAPVTQQILEQRMAEYVPRKKTNQPISLKSLNTQVKRWLKLGLIKL